MGTKLRPPKGMYEPKTRAVLRYCEPGEQHRCFWCDKWVMFKARQHLYRVICNVYCAGKWSRVEVYHAQCYKDAKMPHGAPLK